jgi:hypothetical protein
MPRSAPLLPSAVEGPINAEPTPEYARRKNALVDAETRRSLERAEAAVAADPLHRNRRFERPDGTVVDWSVPGVLLAYAMRDPNTVEYVEFFLTLS